MLSPENTENNQETTPHTEDEPKTSSRKGPDYRVGTHLRASCAAVKEAGVVKRWMAHNPDNAQMEETYRQLRELARMHDNIAASYRKIEEEDTIIRRRRAPVPAVTVGSRVRLKPARYGTYAGIVPGVESAVFTVHGVDQKRHFCLVTEDGLRFMARRTHVEPVV